MLGGIDGQRAYADSTLPQIGTEQGINKNGLLIGPGASVWIQWWPIPEMTIRSLPVTFGDRVYCWLTAINRTRVRCIIRVASGPGPLQRFYLNAPPIRYSPPPIPVHPAKISGATAQWITETPTNSGTDRLFPLPNYGSVNFQQCLALSRPGPLQPYTVEEPIRPTLSNMYRVDGAPGRRKTVSTATWPGPVAGAKVVTTTFVG